MIRIHQLLGVLDPHIVTQRLVAPPKGSFTQIYVLDGRPADDPRLLYLGTPDAFVLTADQLPAAERGTPTFVVAGNSPALLAYQHRTDFNLIVTSLPLADLCNLLYTAAADYSRWVHSMNTHLYIKPDLPALLTCGAQKLGGYACLLDSGYKLLCASADGAPALPALRQMEAESYLSYDNLRALEQLRAQSDDPLWFPVQGEGGAWMLSLQRIAYKSQTAAHQLIALPGGSVTPATQELAAKFHSWVARFVLQYNQDKYELNNALSTLVADLIEGRLTESEQLVGRIKQLPVHVKKYYHCVVVELERYSDPASIGHIMRELEAIFPLALITPYNGDLVVLAWKHRHYSALPFDRARLHALLERYSAYACIGNFTKWLSSLRNIYKQTKGVIQYAKVFCPDPDNRIYRFEDYSMYQIVGMCVDHCSAFHDGDPVYLCHPGVITLASYDGKHGTNLCQVLSAYLKNDRNLTQTARDLFFHRNTLQHKIEKIESIIDESLDSASIRQRLMFSCMVLEYMQKYMKREDVYGRKRNSPPTATLVEE